MSLSSRVFSPISYYCDLCGLPFDCTVLDPFTIDGALYFCCPQCIESAFLLDASYGVVNDRKELLKLLGGFDNV